MVATTRIVAQRANTLPPLENGDHLDQKTFHERYEATPDIRAELIGGIVYISPPMKRPHGRHGVLFCRWFGEYAAATPGTEALTGVTQILGPAVIACLFSAAKGTGVARSCCIRATAGR
jgi:hypothetical protein